MTAATNPARDVLTQAEAEARAARVRNTAYDLAIDLRRGAETYRGDVTIRFDLTGSGDLFLDFRGKTIERLEVNGQTLTPDWNHVRLTLPGAALAPSNTVHIVYENDYDHTGDGLHQFIDPEDGQEYLYTNFEPYEAHRLFPGFDQPDIKATYRLTATAPSAWQIIANSSEERAEDAGDGRTRRTFAQTKPFSTYLFALVAGPYQVIRQQHGDISLGLYCRTSMVKHFDTDEVFEITRQGMDFFQEFFAYPYPFGKYDQVWVPEFNAGAMENVAAVTHSEHYIFRDPPTDTQRKSRGEVILHEMAHMWFGNLVTMRWWNDLWLNESFASYMAYLALVENTRFKDAWTEFHTGMKAWAYRQDQLITTHPIAGRVEDTDQTFLNFDGITYGKGASVLKQLVATIGLDAFRNGMRAYFRRHAFGNATLAQFLGALGEGAGRDLTGWAKLWLETPSLNTLSTVWESDGDRLTSLTLTQTAPAEYHTIRPHTVEVGLVREENGALTVEALPAAIDSAEADIEAARGKATPSFVYPNYNDHAYAKVALDPVSLDYVRDNLDRVTDPLLRILLWSSLWDMVRDQQFSSLAFLDLAAEKIQTETDLELVEAILARVFTAAGRYVPDARRDGAFDRWFDVAWQMLHKARPGDEQITWGRAVTSLAITPEGLTRALRLVDGEEQIAGFDPDQDMRWDLAIRAVIHGHPDAQQRIAAERERDPSDRGQRALLRAETAVPDAGVKAAAWERFHGEGYGSLHLTSAAMGGFHSYRQRELLKPYTDRFFSQVRGFFDTRSKEAAAAYFSNLYPGYRVEQDILDRSERLLAELGDDTPRLSRNLKEAMDDLARALRCRAFAESAG